MACFGHLDRLFKFNQLKCTNHTALSHEVELPFREPQGCYGGVNTKIAAFHSKNVYTRYDPGPILLIPLKQ